MLDPTLTAEEYDALPDGPVKKEYAKKGNSYMLQVAEKDGFRLENTRALRNSVTAARDERDEARTERDELKTQLAGYQAVGSVEEVAALSKGDAGTATGEAKKTLEAERKAEREKFDRDLKTERDARATDRAKHHRSLIKAEVARALNDADVDPDYRGFMEAEVERELIVVEHDGDEVVVARDPKSAGKEKAQPRLTDVSGESGHMTARELVGDVMRKQPRYKIAYRGHGATGSGASDADAGGSGRADTEDAQGGNARGGKDRTTELSPQQRLDRYHESKAKGSQKPGQNGRATSETTRAGAR